MLFIIVNLLRSSAGVLLQLHQQWWDVSLLLIYCKNDISGTTLSSVWCNSNSAACWTTSFSPYKKKSIIWILLHSHVVLHCSRSDVPPPYCAKQCKPSQNQKFLSQDTSQEFLMWYFHVSAPKSLLITFLEHSCQLLHYFLSLDKSRPLAQSLSKWQSAIEKEKIALEPNVPSNYFFNNGLQSRISMSFKELEHPKDAFQIQR